MRLLHAQCFTVSDVTSGIGASVLSCGSSFVSVFTPQFVSKTPVICIIVLFQ